MSIAFLKKFANFPKIYLSIDSGSATLTVRAALMTAGRQQAACTNIPTQYCERCILAPLCRQGYKSLPPRASRDSLLLRGIEGGGKAEETAEKLDEAVEKSDESGIINTGAISGAKKTPGWQDRHAEQMYEQIRHRTTDVKKISENTPFKESAIVEIKQHMFFKKHKFSDGTVKRFDYDFDQAQAWDRLSKGVGTETDLLMLKHEYVELTQMRLHDYDYETAHAIANKRHNWWAAAEEEKY